LRKQKRMVRIDARAAWLARHSFFWRFFSRFKPGATCGGATATAAGKGPRDRRERE
jgi:hypothetical protein